MADEPNGHLAFPISLLSINLHGIRAYTANVDLRHGAHLRDLCGYRQALRLQLHALEGADAHPPARALLARLHRRFHQGAGGNCLRHH
jgi:hypothetical protein